MDLTPVFASAIPEMNKRQSATLGDRTEYIGSSDLACVRKSCLSRQYPRQPDIPTLLKFGRGHAAEWLLENIFKASGIPFDTQVEVSHPKYPLRAHIDVVLYLKEGMHCVEIKSVSSIPDNGPYPQWGDQLMYQLGLLRIHYPKGRITGSVLAIDLNAGELMQYNGFEHDDATFDYLQNKALNLLDALNGEAEPVPSPGLLCGTCSYRSDCPSMMVPKVQLPIEIEMLAAKYAELNETKTKAEKVMKSIRQELIGFAGPSFKGASDNYEMVVTTVGESLAIDGTLLKQNYPDVYRNVQKVRAGYSRLEVKQVQRDELKKAA